MAIKRGDSNQAEVLGVYLEPTASQSVRVGSLLRDPTGAVNFVVDESYIERGPDRPILISPFMRRLGKRIQSRASASGVIKLAALLPSPHFLPISFRKALCALSWKHNSRQAMNTSLECYAVWAAIFQVPS